MADGRNQLATPSVVSDIRGAALSALTRCNCAWGCVLDYDFILLKHVVAKINAIVPVAARYTAQASNIRACWINVHVDGSILLDLFAGWVKTRTLIRRAVLPFLFLLLLHLD